MTRSGGLLLALALAVATLTGCTAGDDSQGRDVRVTTTPSPSPSRTPLPTSESPAGEPPTSASTTSPTSKPEPKDSSGQPADLRGIDVSHHQGPIAWERVASDGIDFAYLKATEGTGFIDNRFVTNAGAARGVGLEVGGYHYYSLCSPGTAQADHFVGVLDRAETNLPPVVDLELIGNCDPPPAKEDLVAEVETFIDRVEAATGTEVVVYFHPDFEATYGVVDDFDRRLWVRRVGDRPPPGDWFIWQRNDAGSVDGVHTPVDLNLMRR